MKLTASFVCFTFSYIPELLKEANPQNLRGSFGLCAFLTNLLQQPKTEKIHHRVKKNQNGPRKRRKKKTPSVARSVLSATPPDKLGTTPWSPYTPKVRNHLSCFGIYQESKVLLLLLRHTGLRQSIMPYSSST